jgi:rod shape-determining protein MreD
MKRGSAAVRVVGPQHWILYPALIALLCTFVLATPVRVFFGWPLPEPVFPLVLSFAWAMIRPSMLAPLALLACGLFLDLLWGQSLGFWPICLLAAYALILFPRLLILGQDTAIVFAWWVGSVTLAFAVGYLLIGIDVGAAPSLVSTFLQWLITVLLYPFADWMVQRFDEGEVRFR